MKKHTMSLEIKKINPKQNAIEYNITTIDDLYQVATLENLDRLMHELKCAFQLTLTMELTANANRETPHKKVNIKQFKWTDD